MIIVSNSLFWPSHIMSSGALVQKETRRQYSTKCLLVYPCFDPLPPVRLRISIRPGIPNQYLTYFRSISHIRSRPGWKRLIIAFTFLRCLYYITDHMCSIATTAGVILFGLACPHSLMMVIRFSLSPKFSGLFLYHP